MLKLLLACPLAAFALSAGGADDELLRVRAKGVALNEGPGARAAACEQAKVAAVVQVLDSLVSSGDLRPVQPIIDRAPFYVRSFREVGHEVSGDGGIQVEIDAYVCYRTVRADAARLLLGALQLTGPPCVVALVGEVVQGAGLVSMEKAGPGETLLVAFLRDAGMDVVPPEAVRTLYAEAELEALAIGGDLALCGRFARANLADAAVLGVIEKGPRARVPGGVFFANEANVRIRVIRSSDDKLIDEYRERVEVQSADVGAGIALAAQDACEKLRQRIIDAIVLAVAGAEPSNDVVVTIERPGGRARFSEIAARIRANDAVEEVEELVCGAALGRFRVAYAGSMREFKEWVVSGQYSDFTLDAHSVVARNMIVTVVDGDTGKPQAQ
ncbi:MAG TPA: hypothetical protein HPP77_04475 [Candidatus Hydrogenedentes bacterium]|nr:hypothetical protein [Candidatus Hydrogenedentota bacterium]HIJ72573.1 hypothetical protein [Candidatus Hydrogenedentota bacterium]